MAKRRMFAGEKFGRLTVIKLISGQKCLCKCECGNVKEFSKYNILNGATSSCGCFRKQKLTDINFINGKSGTRIMKIFYGMKKRCYNTNSSAYKNYGGRGIKICDEWLNNTQNFYDWAIKNGYKDNLSIDRIDVNGNYEPNNCRWANKKVQANNTRLNHLITYNGETKNITQWAKELNISPKILNDRIVKCKLPLEVAMKPIKNLRLNIIEYNGEKRTLTEWAKKLNINRATLSDRIHSGWSVEKAFKTNKKLSHWDT